MRKILFEFNSLKTSISDSARALFILILLCIMNWSSATGQGNTDWMIRGKYGIFMHYQYRILMGYSYKTNPIYPELSQMNAAEWNRYVDGFDVKRFADQMVEGGFGWVMFCIDDAFFAWSCAPNRKLNKYSGYAQGEKCSDRDLILDLSDALHAKGIKLICYFAGFNGYMKDPKVVAGFKDDPISRGELGEKIPPSTECRKRRIAVFKEYANRYKDKIDGWWFDVMRDNSYSDTPYDFWTINSIIRKACLEAVVAFSHGKNNYSHVRIGLDDYTGGDTWSKQDLINLTPKDLPPQDGILWHGKIYCGNIYHGQGDSNQFTDKELIDWIKTCNNLGGVCTLDWPFDPENGLIKDFAMKQIVAIKNALK
jgi:hypothetical protein